MLREINTCGYFGEGNAWCCCRWPAGARAGHDRLAGGCRFFEYSYAGEPPDHSLNCILIFAFTSTLVDCRMHIDTGLHTNTCCFSNLFIELLTRLPVKLTINECFYGHFIEFGTRLNAGLIAGAKIC